MIRKRKVKILFTAGQIEKYFECFFFTTQALITTRWGGFAT